MNKKSYKYVKSESEDVKCDNCGDIFDLAEAHHRGKLTLCPECWDKDGSQESYASLKKANEQFIEKTPRFLIIREVSSGKEINRIDITGKSPVELDQLEDELMKKMNMKDYYTEDNEFDSKDFKLEDNPNPAQEAEDWKMHTESYRAKKTAEKDAHAVDRVGQIMRFEEGEMNDDEIINFFQSMIDDGSVWSLQGSYGRMAQQLIDEGICHHAKEQHQDFYGNQLPVHQESYGRIGGWVVWSEADNAWKCDECGATWGGNLSHEEIPTDCPYCADNRTPQGKEEETMTVQKEEHYQPLSVSFASLLGDGNEKDEL